MWFIQLLYATQNQKNPPQHILVHLVFATSQPNPKKPKELNLSTALPKKNQIHYFVTYKLGKLI